jgi:hypothetical protein
MEDLDETDERELCGRAESLRESIELEQRISR